MKISQTRRSKNLILESISKKESERRSTVLEHRSISPPNANNQSIAYTPKDKGASQCGQDLDNLVTVDGT